MRDTHHGEPVLGLRVADGVPSGEGAPCLLDLRRGALEDGRHGVARQVLREVLRWPSRRARGRPWRRRRSRAFAAAISPNVARVVDERREEVERPDDREVVSQAVDGGVVGRVEADEELAGSTAPAPRPASASASTSAPSFAAQPPQSVRSVSRSGGIVRVRRRRPGSGRQPAWRREAARCARLPRSAPERPRRGDRARPEHPAARRCARASSAAATHLRVGRVEERAHHQSRRGDRKRDVQPVQVFEDLAKAVQGLRLVTAEGGECRACPLFDRASRSCHANPSPRDRRAPLPSRRRPGRASRPGTPRRRGWWH